MKIETDVQRDRAQKMRAAQEVYQQNPGRFFIDVLGMPRKYIWHKMEEVMGAVVDNKRVAVKAGHSVSKTYTAARLVLWFLYCFPPATVITTAPTHTQVEDVLWREIRDAHTRSDTPLGGKILKTKIELSDKWFATGFATRPDTITQQATSFQGYHNDNVFIVFDEAAGIMKQIWEAKDSLLTAGNCKFLAIGNPVSAQGEFVECFKDPKYEKITISVKDSPNYINDHDVIPGLSGKEFEQTIVDKYGSESPQYKARILGKIPDIDVNSLINVRWVNEAYEKRIDFPHTKRFVSADFGGGGDKTNVFLMENTDIKDDLISYSKNKMVVAAEVAQFMERHGVVDIVGDAVGLGSGIMDKLDQMGKRVHRIVSTQRQKSGVPELYYNRRAQMWSEVADKLAEGKITLTWEDEVLKEELVVPKTEIRRGRILVESKKDLRKVERLGRSTDKADSWIMGVWSLPDIPYREDPYKGKETNSYPFNPKTV